MNLWPLLVDDLISGSYSVERRLRPRRLAVAVQSNSVPDAASAIKKLCSKWAGGSMPLLSIDPEVGELDGRWSSILEVSGIDGISGRGMISDAVKEKLSDGDAEATQHLFLQLIEMDERKKVITSGGISEDHPWYISYLATFGDLPREVNRELNGRLELRDNLRFEDLIDVVDSNEENYARGLVEWSRCGELTAVELTRVRLPAGLSTPYNTGLPGSSRFSFGINEAPRKYGPNVVVVYDKGSVDDLALIWNLRAKLCHPKGLPLAIPYTDSIAEDLDVIAGHGGACHHFGFGHSIAVTSFSVPLQDLREIDAETTYDVVDPWDLIEDVHGYFVSSAEVVQFSDGSASIPDFSSTDIKELGQGYLGSSHATWLTLTTIIKGNELPPSRTMRRGKWKYYDVGYSTGKITHVGKLDSFTKIFHPSGLETLRALGADLGLDARPSEPGKAAEQLVRAASGNLSMFASTGVTKLLGEMSRRGHASLVKRRLDQYLAGTVPDGSDRYELLLDKLNAAIGSPDLEEVGYMTFNRIKQMLDLSKDEAIAWVEWAVSHRILIRGFEAACSACGHRQWRALADAVPELVCHGCGRVITNPFGVDRIEHRYRASETLLRAMNSDVLPPILAMRYVAELLGGPTGSVFGIYPGIELREEGSIEVLAEIDCLVVLKSGKWILGECKARARGLNEHELDKLWLAADRVGAIATFSSTLDRSDECGTIWRTEEAPSGRPHFSLVAEHLYQTGIIGPTYGAEYFEWPDKNSDADNSLQGNKLAKEFGRLLLLDQSDNEKWRRAYWESKSDS
ncbi:hypothetical protein GV794_23810 [Nocardia cyriacigeorgica]|uniref:Uncharacterized protein n=1 Tax=Nocardia cyriacigeorgica TaxID=135487 RepID=A0A6P1D9X4_9NOCA|nr:hypothetical protein [Nocardia cyriacigeorgica]NEW45523.1 hypothetical protein [Nocardia cyriacigeorgica]NEW58647.1 hypothetical protein [Nocardia cyriacigeorgica]